MGNVKFTVYERPVPCVRMTQKSKFVNPQAKRYLAYKKTLGWACKVAMRGKQFEGNVRVAMQFYLHGKRLPDVDNLAKAVLDSCNKIAWLDDKQVVSITADRIGVDSKGEERTDVLITGG